jgi:arylsulfatase
MENYAAFLAHTDHEVGRLVGSLEKSGELDNTLVFYIVGDNGASAEGGLEGTFNELASLAGYNPGLAGITKRIDLIGEPESDPHVPVGWAWAMNAPFQWTKQVASHFGGTRNPMVVLWPKGIKAKGELREQFCHCIDVVPTILEAAQVTPPDQVAGIQQKPIEGISLAYSFDDRQAKDRRTTQYFEMMGNRGIYHDGWMATTRHGTPWLTAAASRGFDNDAWELYDIDQDFSQADDLASKNPEKVKQLQALFLEEAKKYDVLPLDDRMAARLGARNRVAGQPRTSWTYYGNNVRMPDAVGPIVYPNSHTITAELSIPEKGCEGVIACTGGGSIGWAVYVQNGKLTYHYNFFDFEHTTIQAKDALPSGKVTVKLEYESKGGVKGLVSDGARVRLFVNGQLVGEGDFAKAAARHAPEPFEIGRDSISPVDPAYKEKVPFAFTGAIEQIDFALAKDPAVGAAAGATAEPAAEGEAKLTGDWKLAKLGEEPTAAGAIVTLSVAADGKVSGSTGVNRFAGQLAKEKKLFGPLGMTRRAGPPEAMAVEAAFAKALDEATRFTIKEDKLTLFAGDKPRLVFERQKPAEK